jgi:hypothetical protein
MITPGLVIGIDVGKRHDPTALAVAMCEDREGDQDQGKHETHYVIPFLTRLPLDMPYPQQARELIRLSEKAFTVFKAKLLQHNAYAEPYASLFPDVTGVGDGMVDLIKPELANHFHVVPCRFTHGDSLNSVPGEYRIGKSWFANRLQVLSEGKRIHISPDLPDAGAVATELLNFDIEVDETTGIDRYGAIRPGTHDDLVCALGMACLPDPFKGRIEFTIPKQAIRGPAYNPIWW